LRRHGRSSPALRLLTALCLLLGCVRWRVTSPTARLYVCGYLLGCVYPQAAMAAFIGLRVVGTGLDVVACEQLGEVLSSKAACDHAELHGVHWDACGGCWAAAWVPRQQDRMSCKPSARHPTDIHHEFLAYSSSDVDIIRAATPAPADSHGTAAPAPRYPSGTAAPAHSRIFARNGGRQVGAALWRTSGLVACAATAAHQWLVVG
jgi:hypothetical protein